MDRMKGMMWAAVVLAVSSLSAAPASGQQDGLTEAFGGCMDASGGVTFAMIDCISAEYERQDERLNQLYQTLMSSLDYERRETLRAAQRAWIEFRDANCDFYFDPQGGTSARLAANSCIMSETAERADELVSFTRAY
jgi:uncharacterized protein YecT (DUF1311 family)